MYQTRRGVVSPRARNWTQVLRTARCDLGVTLFSPLWLCALFNFIAMQTWGDRWCYHCFYWTERALGGAWGHRSSSELSLCLTQASRTLQPGSLLSGILLSAGNPQTAFISLVKFFDNQTGRPFPRLMCLSPSSGRIVNCPRCFLATARKVHLSFGFLKCYNRELRSGSRGSDVLLGRSLLQTPDCTGK